MQCKELFQAALEFFCDRLDGSKLGSPKKFFHSLRGFQHFGDNEDCFFSGMNPMICSR